MSARPSGSPTEIAMPRAMPLVMLKKTPLPSNVIQAFAELSYIHTLFGDGDEQEESNQKI